LPIKAFSREQRSVIRFLWTKGLSANAIHADMRPLCDDKTCFTRPPVHVWYKKLLITEKVLELLRRNLDLAASSIVFYVYMNLDNTLKKMKEVFNV